MPALEEEGGTLNSIISVNKNILIMITSWTEDTKRCLLGGQTQVTL